MPKVYICDICNRNYKSYQTLWKHNKTFHKPDLAYTIDIDKPDLAYHNVSSKININVDTSVLTPEYKYNMCYLIINYFIIIIY
jgi:hypothetical protein